MKKLKIIVDINHPGHVHFWKNLIKIMQSKGHKIKIIASLKDVATELLDEYKLKYENIGSYGESILKKALNIPIMDWKMWQKTRNFHPDLFLGIASLRAAHISSVLGVPSFIFDDTDHKKDFWLYKPFARRIYTPSCFKKDLGKKQIRYNSYHELAYLYPRYFKPRPEILKKINLGSGQKYFILRFVSWQAGHDIGQKGLSPKGKIELVRILSKSGRVIISSEKPLGDELKKYSYGIKSSQMHDLLSYASMYIGEGATMASEAAVLGVPSIFISSLSAGTLEEQEKKYGLILSFKSEKKAFNKISELLKTKDLGQKWQRKREKMLAEKEDLTAYIIKEIEKYDW